MCLQARLSLGGAAAAGGSGRAGRAPIGQQVPRVLVLRSSPGSPFQAHPSHSPRAAGPHSPQGHGVPPLPAAPWSQAVAHDAFPSSHSPGSLHQASRSLCKRETARCAKLSRRTAGLRTWGVCAPPSPLLSSSLCELLCGVPCSSSNRSPCVFLQKRLKMPASRPSVTGPTWRAPSS